MEYDCGDCFSFDFEPNEIPFTSKSKGIMSPRSYPIQCERKGKSSFPSAILGATKSLIPPDNPALRLCNLTDTPLFVERAERCRRNIRELEKKFWLSAHREIFSESYQIKPKSDCIYHFPNYLDSNVRVRLDSNKSENGKYNLISV